MVLDARLTFERFTDQDPRLLRAAAAELDELDRSLERAQHLAGVQVQNFGLGPGQVVLGQLRDRFEQRAAQRVVEIFRRKVLLRGAEARAHVVREGLRLNDDGSAIKQEALVDRRELVALRNHSNLIHPRS